MRYLCDSNVFLALAVGQHLHHRRAAAWFAGLVAADKAEFCRATQISFLRLLTQKIAPEYLPVSNEAGRAAFDQLMEDDVVEFAMEPENIDSVWRSFGDLVTVAPKVWMDSYLAAFAIAAGMRFVTMDGDFKRFETHGLDLLLLHS